ncbi:MAG: monomeric, partial [Oscillospiraceae bacterium]|nr:monomeric [FeFe] hydrogenase [Oscillospiraceae bacterium]
NPCKEVCPKGAISIRHGKSRIDQEKCIKCGRCKDVCPYGAVLKVERPCERACGMNAIGSDEHGRAKIDYEKCVSCGMCLVNCPFGAIAEKGQIFQLIHAIKTGKRVVAIVAPAFYGQFGKLGPEKLTPAMRRLGFDSVAEVAVGADLCTVEEARMFLEEVPDKLDFMATSCCPAWSSMAKRLFPELADNISMALTPMVLTARLEKKKDPDCLIAFIGPCSAKKLEASRVSVRSYVDFVLTFEELMGMFYAKEVNIDDIPDDEAVPLDQGTGAGRGFAVSGGVAGAVAEEIRRIDPTREVKTASAQGLAECRKLRQMAKAHKYDGYLLEGMGCPGGCVAGAGTLCAVNKATMGIDKYKKQAEKQLASETAYIEDLSVLEEFDL